MLNMLAVCAVGVTQFTPLIHQISSRGTQPHCPFRSLHLVAVSKFCPVRGFNKSMAAQAHWAQWLLTVDSGYGPFVTNVLQVFPTDSIGQNVTSSFVTIRASTLITFKLSWKKSDKKTLLNVESKRTQAQFYLHTIISCRSPSGSQSPQAVPTKKQE